jgi:hypothetical protein
MNEDHQDERSSLYDQLEEDDWALIIGPDGSLRGMFIPEGKDEDEVPHSIVYIMERFFGVDFNEEESDDNPTIH